MRFVRKLQNVSPNGGRNLTVSIPSALNEIFYGSSTAVIETLADEKGIIVRPAKVMPMS